jgi:hypothetical protein
MSAASCSSLVTVCDVVPQKGKMSLGGELFHNVDLYFFSHGVVLGIYRGLFFIFPSIFCEKMEVGGFGGFPRDACMFPFFFVPFFLCCLTDFVHSNKSGVGAVRATGSSPTLSLHALHNHAGVHSCNWRGNTSIDI